MDKSVDKLKFAFKYFKIMQTKNLKSIFSFLVLLFYLLTFQNLIAQEAIAKFSTKKNFVKLNLPSLFLGSASVQYERILGKHWTTAIGVRYTPGFNIDLSPLLSKEDSLLEDVSEKIKLSTFAVYNEYRYYFGKETGNGIYLSGLLKYNKWKMGFDFNRIDSLASGSIDMYGNWTSLTAGLNVGYQFKIYKNFYADWWIGGVSFGYAKLGAHLGSSDLKFDPDRVKEINDILQMPDGGILNKKKSYVSENEINLESNWSSVFGLRTGFCLAYRF